jgi:hypothetical protein
MQKYLKFIVFILLIALVLPRPVKAYLDPGSASYLFQLLIAGALGALFYLKSIIKWFKNIFSGNESKKSQPTENEKE